MSTETKKYHILYVEDQQYEMKGIIAKLRHHFELTLVRDSKSATSLLLSQNHAFSLILLDIRLANPGIPDKNKGRTAGIDFVTGMQASFLEQNRSIPIVVYTAEPLTEIMEDKLSGAGVRGIIRKTGSGREILQFIKQILAEEYESPAS